jgi:3,4-dihydroxyphthalate decarboxylase
MGTTATGLDELRREVAVGCRVLAATGLVENVLGHIGVRVDDETLLVRCRGPAEAGLRFTGPDDVRLVEATSGRVLDDPGGRYAPPNELPIHTATLAARPDVACVVHAHPPEVVVASIAGVALTPIFGAYDIPAARLAAGGIPTHPRSVLIRTPELAAEMVASLGEAAVLILAGHGLVSTGAGVAEAVLRAIQVDTLARVHLRVRAAGGDPRPIPEADLVELPDLGPGLNQATLWRHHLAALDGGPDNHSDNDDDDHNDDDNDDGNHNDGGGDDHRDDWARRARDGGR